MTIAVSGAMGGHTVDFRQLAAKGMVLLGRAESFRDGTMLFAADLADNIAAGDADYLSVLDQADAYIAREKLDWPEDTDARAIGPDPRCVTVPILSLDLATAGVSAIIWATGYALDFDWLKVDERSGMSDQRREEAERLIMLARALLNRPQEELVVNHLAQAVEVLHMVIEEERAQSR